MPNWLASELCMVASFSLGAWKTFKVLKHGGTDYNLLKTWCLLGLLRVFEEYFEFLVSWIPFYWLGKCLGLGLLYLPGGNIPTVVFERVVVWGMDNAHHVLNSLVVPNVVEFAVSFPWRVLLILFPSMPPPPLRGATTTNNGGRKGGTPRKRGKDLASQLQHLNTRSARTIPKAGRSGGRTGGVSPPASPASRTPPPLPPRSPPSAARNSGGEGVVDAATKKNGDALILVAQLLDEGNNNKDDGSADGGKEPGVTQGTSSESRGSAAGGGGGRRPARRRRSFGEIFRSAVTGNSQVRLRDHLFDLNTASPAPPPAAGDGSGAVDPEHQQQGDRQQDKRGEGGVVGTAGEESSPKRGPASRLPAVVGSDDSDISSKKRAGQKTMKKRSGGVAKNGEGEGADGVPDSSSAPTPLVRSRHPTRRRPSEFSEPVVESVDTGDSGGGGGGGDGDEAGGGGGDGEISGSTSTIGGVGVRRRPGVGVGDRGQAEARAGARPGAGRRSLVNINGSSSSVASKASAARVGGSTTTTRSAARRGLATTKATAAPRGSSIASGVETEDGADGGGGSSGAPSTAAAIADSRAKRLAEWRKKRADRASEEQAERTRRSRYDGGSGNVLGAGGGSRAGRPALNEVRVTARYRSGSGDGDVGGGNGVNASVRGGGGSGLRASAVPNASALLSTQQQQQQPAASNSRRFRHVERFRADMATGGHG